MRSMLVLCLLASTAFADKKRDNKIVDMTPGFERELGACEMQEGGIKLMLERAKAYAPTAPASDKVDLDKDIDKLAKGHAVLVTYCAEVKAMVTLLKDNATTAYKKIEKAVDARDNAVRKARREGKKVIDELAPITRKLIPKVTARVPQVEEKKQTAKFPSGRIVELPSMTGSWKLGGNLVTDIAEYATAGVTATVTTRPFSNATCDQQRKQFVAKAGDEPIADLDLSDAAKALNVQWSWRYVRRDKVPHMLTMMCVPVATGGFIAIADITPTDQRVLAEDMTKLMVTMLALQLPKPAS